MIYGFPPIAGPDARVLVLGSMPGVRSLAAGQYYANPQNAFWPILGQLFAWESGLDYATRTALLLRTRIALWDVLQAAERPGSLDAAIVAGSERANDFAAFFAAHPAIHSVFFNGTKAAASFNRARWPPICASTICRRPAQPMLGGAGRRNSRYGKHWRTPCWQPVTMYGHKWRWAMGVMLGAFTE
jgi:hypoxanthine-DNA glycosylase